MISLFTVALCAFLTSFAYGYMGAIEVALASFKILNPRVASEGSSCDTDHAFSSYNPCDLVFYVQDCRSDNTLTMNCVLKINRFYGFPNQDEIVFNASLPRPQTMFNLIGGFPRTLAANVTVIDEDEGSSGDDYIGTYPFYFTQSMLNKGGKQFANEILMTITIPDHSEMVIAYRAYCLDYECRSAPV